MNHLETEAQLSAILYRPTSSGRTEIESKEEARKRGQSSPDRAEALVMAFLKVVLREETVVFQRSCHHSAVLSAWRIGLRLEVIESAPQKQ